MTRALCTAWSANYQGMADLTEPTMEAWAQAHGWTVMHGRIPVDFARPPSWYKVRLLQLLLEHFDEALWVDVDAAFVRLDEDLSWEGDIGMVWLRAPEAETPIHHELPNAGVLAVRRGARPFLDAVWSMEQHVDNKHWEQAAIFELLGYSSAPPWEKQRVGLVAVTHLDKRWNAMTHWEHVENPVIVHHAGVPYDDRLDRMRATVGALA